MAAKYNYCPVCQVYGNRLDVTFCKTCGHELDKNYCINAACREHGIAVDFDTMYCETCGSPTSMRDTIFERTQHPFEDVDFEGMYESAKHAVVNAGQKVSSFIDDLKKRNEAKSKVVEEEREATVSEESAAKNDQAPPESQE